MAYAEQASVANASEVVDRVASFAAANGWTLDRNVANPDGTRIATVRKAGVSDYVHLYTYEGEHDVCMRISTGYAPALPVDEQPNASKEYRTTLEAGPYPNTFLFASGDQVWATLAIARNAEYRSLAFGVLEKAGAYVGGTYVTGTTWGRNGYYGVVGGGNSGPFFSGAVRANADGRLGQSFPFGYGYGFADSAPTDVGTPDYGLSSAMAQLADDNAFSGRSVFHPITVYLGRTGSEVFYSPLGVVQDVRVCSLAKFAPEQEVTIGADVYKVFPLAARRPEFPGPGDLPAASGMHGYAVRKAL